MTLLRRWLAVWSDGVTRVLHAHTPGDALELAQSLGVPAGVYVTGCRALDGLPS